MSAHLSRRLFTCLASLGFVLAGLLSQRAVYAQGFGNVPFQDTPGDLVLTLRQVPHTSAPAPPSARVNLESPLLLDLKAVEPQMRSILTKSLGRGRRWGGQTMYDIQIRFGTTAQMQQNGSAWRLLVHGNRLDAKLTTPDLFLGIGAGKYADPKFAVWFTLVIDFRIEQKLDTLIARDVMLSATGAKPFGKNLTGAALTMTNNLVKIFSGKDFLREIGAGTTFNGGRIATPNLNKRLAALTPFLKKYVVGRNMTDTHSLDHRGNVVYTYQNFGQYEAPKIK